MINFVLGMFLMWAVLSLAIFLGDQFLDQHISWDEWWAYAVVFPIMVFFDVVCAIVDLINFIKKLFKKS